MNTEYESKADVAGCKYGSSFWYNRGVLLDEKFNPVDGATYRLILDKDCHIGNTAGGVQNTLILFKDNKQILREIVVPRHGPTNMRLLGMCEIAMTADWLVEDLYHPHQHKTHREKATLGWRIHWAEKGHGGYFLNMRHRYSWFTWSCMRDFYDTTILRDESVPLGVEDFMMENLMRIIESHGMKNPRLPLPRDTSGIEIAPTS